MRPRLRLELPPAHVSFSWAAHPLLLSGQDQSGCVQHDVCELVRGRSRPPSCLLPFPDLVIQPVSLSINDGPDSCHQEASAMIDAPAVFSCFAVGFTMSGRLRYWMCAALRTEGPPCMPRLRHFA